MHKPTTNTYFCPFFHKLLQFRQGPQQRIFGIAGAWMFYRPDAIPVW